MKQAILFVLCLGVLSTLVGCGQLYDERTGASVDLGYCSQTCDQYKAIDMAQSEGFIYCAGEWQEYFCDLVGFDRGHCACAFRTTPMSQACGQTPEEVLCIEFDGYAYF